MRFSSWLRNQKGPGPGVRGHAPKMTRKRAMSRLRLEVLEDRWLPSTLTVTSPLDDGSSGTLRAVIAAASPGTEILFAKSVHTITLTGGPAGHQQEPGHRRTGRGEPDRQRQQRQPRLRHHQQCDRDHRRPDHHRRRRTLGP